MKNYLLKVYHSYNSWRKHFEEFLEDIWKTLEHKRMVFWLNYKKWEFFYSLNLEDDTLSSFESQFYSFFNNFQIDIDDKNYIDFNPSKTVIWELYLKNKYFFPFKLDITDNTDFISWIYRSFENLNVASDKLWFFVDIKPIKTESIKFYLKSKYKLFLFKWKLKLQFFKYMFNYKVQNNWKEDGFKYYKWKIDSELFETKVYFIVESDSKQSAISKLTAITSKFLVFKNYPLNQFDIKIRQDFSLDFMQTWKYWISHNLTALEISNFFFHKIQKMRLGF